MNNTKQKRKLKDWRQAQRNLILRLSKRQKSKSLEGNLCIYLGGVMQRSHRNKDYTIL